MRPTVGEHFMTHRDFIEINKKTFTGEYTENLCVNGIATASSTYYENEYLPALAFDNTELGFASGSNIFPQWIKYELIEAKIIERYTLASYKSGGSEMMTSWELQGSNNNTDWVVLDTRSEETGWTWLSQTRIYDFANTNAYKYYKWNILANTSGLLWIGEIEMMEGVYE